VSAFAGVPAMIRYGLEAKNNLFLLEMADNLSESTTHLSGLLDELLAWAMQQQGQITLVRKNLSLSEIIHEVIGTFHNVARGKKIELTAEIEEDLHVWADRNMISTIVRNLVNNALKFTESGGQVRIQAKSENEDIILSVSDTGVGIPDDLKNSMFEFKGRKTAFGTAGEKGLGLGLQLVYEFVLLNEGSISVESKVGKGSTFTIRLPSQEVSQLLQA
jgi:signal transduction histidine kinase